jgi:hypothetical protein
VPKWHEKGKAKKDRNLKRKKTVRDGIFGLPDGMRGSPGGKEGGSLRPGYRYFCIYIAETYMHKNYN